MHWNGFCYFEPSISRALAARVFILGTAIEVGVVYCQTCFVSPVSECGSMYEQTAGKIGLIFAKI